MDVLLLGHTVHTVVGGDSRIGRTVFLVSDLVVSPHVEPERAVAECFENVSRHHAVRSGLVPRCLALDGGEWAYDVADAVADEDARRGDHSFRVRADVGGDHDEADSEADRLGADTVVSKNFGAGWEVLT